MNSFIFNILVLCAATSQLLNQTIIYHSDNAENADLSILIHDTSMGPITVGFRYNEKILHEMVICNSSPQCQCTAMSAFVHSLSCQQDSSNIYYTFLRTYNTPNVTAFIVDQAQSSIHTNKTAELVGGMTRHLVSAQEALLVPLVVTDMESTYNISSDLQFQWKFNPDNSFDMIVHWNKKSWVGIGFSGTMTDCDMLVFSIVNGNTVVVSDTYSTGHSTPAVDTQQDITIISEVMTSSGYSIRFNRKLNTGDSQDEVLTKGNSYTFCFGYSSAESLEQHSFYASFDITWDSGIVGTATLITPNIDLYYAHGIILFLAWGVVADFGIIIGRFFKNINSYLWIHAFSFIFVDFATIIIALIMVITYEAAESELVDIHKFISIIVIAAVIFQHILGVVVKHLLEQNVKQNNQNVTKLRWVHVIFGTLLYLTAKAELIIGLIANENDVLLILGIIWIILLIIIRIALEIRRKNQQSIQYKIAPQQKSILNQNQTQLMEMLNNHQPTQKIIDAMPDLLWVLLNQDVYDLTDYQHPAGNFIIKSVQGREISRFFFGAYPLESTTMDAHNHSQIAYAVLQSRYIGTLESSLLKTEEKSNNSSQTWVIDKKIQLSANINQFEFSKPGLQIRLQQSIKEIGQHFSVSFDEIGGKVRMYTKVLSMSEPCVDFRKQALEYFDKIMAGQDAVVPKLVKVQSQSLPLIIKKYRFPKALSAELFETTKPVYIEGPFGRGLEIETNGQSVAFVGGTGLLPFIDLLDHLLMKSIYTVVKTKNPQKAKELFSQDEELSDNFQFTMMASFLNEEEFIGKQWIRRLYKINQDHNLKLFSMQIRYSDGKLDETIPSFHSRFNLDLVQKQLGDNQKQIYVCGPPVMNKSIIDILGKTEQNPAKIYIV